MAFKFNCPNPACNIHIEGEEDWAGETIACPSCGQEMVVPEPEPEASATMPTTARSRTGLQFGIATGAIALVLGGLFLVTRLAKQEKQSGPDSNPATGGSAAGQGLPLVVDEASGPSTDADEGPDLIWVEGEAADSSNARTHNWYSSVKKDQLSGGDWLIHYSGAGPAEASWRVPVTKAGQYDFWIRANPTAKARLAWRLNRQDEWQEVDFSEATQSANIAADGKIDMRFVAWVKAGSVSLTTGETVVELRLHSGVQNHGGIDCFVFSAQPFTPAGKLKPGEKTGRADPGMWAFEPGTEPTTPRLDLARLNEATAGMQGFVGRNDQGDFVDGRGQPIRFWAVNTAFHERTTDLTALRTHARWLARRGVNMVRSHSHLLSKAKDAGLDDVDEEEIARIHRLVAVMRDEGIYTTISPYWATATKWRPSLGLDDPGSGNLNGMLFWDEKLQRAYQGWWRKLLTTDNPHTGTPLAKEPAVAILQLQNEDSLLFFTLQNVKGEPRRDLRRRFHTFLIDKHGSISKAAKAWGTGKAAHKNDNPGGREMGLFSIWELTRNASGAKQNRFADQLEFYGRLMHDFNARMTRFLRDELGCRQLINAGNWKTADAAKMFDIERWSYTATDVVGVNRYFNGGQHVNPQHKDWAGYRVTQGDLFSNQSVLRQPRRFPLALKQPANLPFIASESSWVAPLKHQSEGPFLVAAYSLLTGFDAFYWFSTADFGYGNPMGKFQINTPMQIGQFPAAALLFRRGYVRRAEPVLNEHRSLDDLWQRRKPLAVEDAGYDPNRDQGSINELSAVKTSMDPLAYLAGPVVVHYDSDPAKSRQSAFQAPDGVVTSGTGELKWDTRNGICSLDAPKAQGVTGFVAGRQFRLSDLTIESENDYLTVLAVSLDELDLKDSRQVLVQIGTVTRPFGWRTRAKGDSQEIVKLGGPPWNIARAKVRLKLGNQHLTRAETLDANFRTRGEAAITDGQLQVPEDALYLLLLQ